MAAPAFAPLKTPKMAAAVIHKKERATHFRDRSPSPRPLFAASTGHSIITIDPPNPSFRVVWAAETYR